MGYLRSPIERRHAYGIEDLAYKGAAAITTVSPGLVDLLSKKASAAGRVELIPNGVECDRFLPGLAPSIARGRLGWAEKFTVVYAGTVGLAQGIGTLLEAAAMLGNGVSIRVVGEGIEKPELEARVRAKGLRNVTFHPSVPQVEVPTILAVADAGLVILRKGPLFEASLPTKLLELMAAGRPVIASADGLSAQMVGDAGAGYVARAEDPVGLAHAIDECRRDLDRAARGAIGRELVMRSYERSAILDRLAAILARVASAT